MTSAKLVNLKGKDVGEVTLEDSVFGIEPNQDVLFNSLIRQLANARAGSAKAQTRAEVRGGGRKPWRQKGTGRARAGSLRSPLFKGGGVVFGPKPRDYYLSMPKKQRQLALKSALAAKKDVMVVVKDFADLKEAKTKQMANIMKDLGLADKKTLLVLDFGCDQCDVVARSARNLARVKVVHVNNLSVKDLIDADSVLTQESVINVLNNRFRPNGDATASGAVKKSRARAKSAEGSEEKPKAKAPKAAAAPKAEKPKAEPKPKVAKPKAEAEEPKAKKKEAADQEAKPAKKKKED